jgi:formylglycine-generating enzyme required for sulfatase activity
MDMPDNNRALKVFLCHAHSDKDAVKALYARLKREGVDVWLDKEKLLPGADWELEIRKAVREADVVVVCLSNQFNQAGFRQKEVRIALDAAMEKPEGEIFIIPARLEECDTLESLRKWHWVDLFERDGFQRLILALRIRAKNIGATLRERGRATASRPKIKDEQKAAAEKARLEAEEAERQRLAKEKADREVADAARLAREKAEKEAAEKARLESEELERRRLAREIAEQADREAAERVAREKAEKDAQEKAAAEKARLDAEELERQRLARAKADRRKTPRKTNPAVIFGGIGLLGIILVAILASLWGEIFTPAPQVTATATSEVTVTSAPTETKQPAPTKTPTKFFTPTATALPDEMMDNGVPMRLVPAGEFEMGSDADDALAECQKFRNDCQRDWFTNEEPPHEVYLDAFYMDKYEVTNALYKACEEAGECQPPQDTSRYDNPEYENHPVVYVNWNQAKAYCEWRGTSTGSGYTRLPTEAQWEKAARGTDGRAYPWGEDIDCDRANYYDGNRYCVGDTTPVDSYESGQSPYGIYNLAGNVWEWTADWYSETYYQSSPLKNPLGPDSGTSRVLRGGSWYDLVLGVRSANRYWVAPSHTGYDLGFRCARSLP